MSWFLCCSYSGFAVCGVVHAWGFGSSGFRVLCRDALEGKRLICFSS